MRGAVAVFVDGDAEETRPGGGSGTHGGIGSPIPPVNTRTSGPPMAAISRRSRCR
jgi:hypothetical protein